MKGGAREGDYRRSRETRIKTTRQQESPLESVPCSEPEMFAWVSVCGFGRRIFVLESIECPAFLGHSGPRREQLQLWCLLQTASVVLAQATRQGLQDRHEAIMTANSLHPICSFLMNIMPSFSWSLAAWGASHALLLLQRVDPLVTYHGTYTFCTHREGEAHTVKLSIQHVPQKDGTWYFGETGIYREGRPPLSTLKPQDQGRHRKQALLLLLPASRERRVRLSAGGIHHVNGIGGWGERHTNTPRQFSPPSQREHSQKN